MQLLMSREYSIMSLCPGPVLLSLLFEAFCLFVYMICYLIVPCTIRLLAMKAQPVTKGQTVLHQLPIYFYEIDIL